MKYLCLLPLLHERNVRIVINIIISCLFYSYRLLRVNTSALFLWIYSGHNYLYWNILNGLICLLYFFFFLQSSLSLLAGKKLNSWIDICWRLPLLCLTRSCARRFPEIVKVNNSFFRRHMNRDNLQAYHYCRIKFQKLQLICSKIFTYTLKLFAKKLQNAYTRVAAFTFGISTRVRWCPYISYNWIWTDK